MNTLSDFFEEKPFEDHIRELRMRFGVCLIIYIFCACGIYCFIGEIYHIIAQPFLDIQQYIAEELVKGSAGLANTAPPIHSESESLKNSQTFYHAAATSRINLIFNKIGEGFNLHMKICAIGALCLSLPFFIIQIYQFCSSALYLHQRTKVKVCLISSIILFFIGILIGYHFILPIILRFLIEYETFNIPDYITLQANWSQYLSFLLWLCLICGLCLQLPIIGILLQSLDIDIATYMRKCRKYSILGIAIIASIVTPPDVLSQCMLIIIMLCIYEFTLLILKYSK